MTEHAAPPPLDELLARREWVRRFARTLARDDASADDLEQDAWVAAIEHPPRHVEAPAGWLRRVLVRRAIDVSISTRRRDARELAASRPVAAPATADVVAAAECHRRVVEAVLALDEPYRTTVLLRFFEDLPPREVARRMNAPVETVRARVRRAVERLRRALDEENDGRRNAWLAPLLAPDAGGTDAPTTRTASGAGANSWLALATAAALVGAASIVALTWPSAPAPDGDETASARTAPAADARHRSSPRAADGAGDEDATDAAVVPDTAQPANAAAAPDPDAPHDFTVRVVDAAQTPVAGVRVRIDPAKMDREPDAVTGDDGCATFRVTGDVRSASFDDAGADGRAWRAARRFVGVAPGAVRAELAVERAAWIKGSVTRTDAAPFANLEVAAVRSNRTIASSYTDAKGAFAIAVPEGAAVDVVVTGWSRQRFPENDRNTPEGRVHHVMDQFQFVGAEADAVAPGTEGIALTAIEPVETGALTVRVVATDGTPVADVPISADRGAFGDAAHPLVTDADGRCVIEGVPMRRVDVCVARHLVRSPPAWETAGWATPRERLLARPGAGEAVFVLAPGHAIRGRIEPAGELRGNVHAVSDDEYVADGFIDDSGRFALVVAASLPGPFTLRAECADAAGRVFKSSLEAVRAGADDVVLKFDAPVPTVPAAPQEKPPKPAEPK